MRLVIAVLLVTGALSAQTIWTVPLWNGKTYVWHSLGPGLTIKSGVLDALPQPAPTVPRRVYGTALTPPTNGTGYALPAGASNVAVWRNGIRQEAGADYQILSGALVPLVPWSADGRVLVDYDAASTP
jgi:hypothetical protein